MSVVVVRANLLCDRCIHLGLPYEQPENGGLRLMIECNDLCSECIKSDEAYVRFAGLAEDGEIVNQVIARSPWLKRERRERRWRRIKAWFLHKWERFQRWNHYGFKAFLPRGSYVRCCSCGYNYLPEDLDAVSGDGEMCAPCFDKYTRNPCREVDLS